MIISATQRLTDQVFSKKITLDDGKTTTVHVATYHRSGVLPKLVLFQRQNRLLTWCKQNNIKEALVGGFFLRNDDKPLGETWIAGVAQDHEPFTAPWHTKRGSLYITTDTLALDYRYNLPDTPAGDLLQAGPLLVKNSTSLHITPNDREGFSTACQQFDSDITIGRHPRAAIGINETHIFSVVCDGRSADDAGMTLGEMAETMCNLGCTEALNLDGGGSASLVTNGELLNTPRGDGIEYPEGRPIYSAICFEKIKD